MLSLLERRHQALERERLGLGCDEPIDEVSARLQDHLDPRKVGCRFATVTAAPPGPSDG